jgi:group I intron endonuclease
MCDTYLIYKHTSPSGKSYIGQTKDYNRRCAEHQSSDVCRALNSAIKKYEWDNFQHEILMEGLSLDEANHWEPVLIAEHDTLAPNGYNLRTGGLNSSPSEETKTRMSNSSTGKTHTEETKAKISEAKLGHIVSDEAKAKLSTARLGKKRSNFTDETKAKMSASRLGYAHSEETKAKISAAKLGKKRGPYKKKEDDTPPSV